MDISIFKKLNFSDRDAAVYLSLLALGPSSVRTLAQKVEVNRGSVHESLKWLRERGLVSFFEKETKQYFVAEDPSRLRDLLEKERQQLGEMDRELSAMVAELKSMHDRGGQRPVARYYEKGDTRQILEHVLQTCEQTNCYEYRVYSDAGIREYLYEGFESFSDARVAKGIAVKVIAFGGGGMLRGLDERKWVQVKSPVPTYTIIYPGNVAYISLNAQGELVGVVINNDGVFETQRQIFDELWSKL